MTRPTRITIETERILVLARSQAIRGWCEGCGCEVELLPREQLTPVLDVVALASDEPSRRRLHLERAKDGLRVCLKSMLLLLGTSGRRHITR
jgi:hypothetical protein